MKKTAILLSLLVLTLLSAAAWAQTSGAVLTGSQEVPPADPDGQGVATLTFNNDRTQLTADITFSGIGTVLTGAHIHEREAGANGPVVIPFLVTTTTITNGRITGTFPVTDPALATRLATNPSGFYVNLHNSQFPGGAIRGQLSAISGGVTTFVGDMRADRETPTPGPPGGAGSFVVSFNEARTQMTWTAAVSGIGNNITNAHIHTGAEGVPGPVLIGFNPSFVNGRGTGVVSNLDPAVVNTILANPAGFYVNVHTTEFPAGAVRGQLIASNDQNTAFLPVIGRVSNATETFVTDVRIFNPSFTATAVTVEFFPAGGERQFRSLTIPARGTAVLNDIVGGEFGTTGIGGARITSAGTVIAGARIFSDRRPTGGTIGQFFPSAQPMRRGVLTQIAQNSATRTNIGLFNQSDSTVTVRLELRDAAGTVVGSQTLALAPRSFRQDAVNVHIAAASNLTDGTLTFDASAPIMAYASVVDNFTTDPSAVLPIPDPSIPTNP